MKNENLKEKNKGKEFKKEKELELEKEEKKANNVDVEVKKEVKVERIEDNSKKKVIMTFIIGFLVGAIITAGLFLIFKPKDSKQSPDFSKFNKDGEKLNPGSRELPEGFDPSNSKDGERPNGRSRDNSEENNKVE